MRSLYPHQIPAVRYCLDTRNPLIFLEMRLGKCLIVIRALERIRKPGERVLIVAPVDPLGSWEEELKAEGLEYSKFGSDQKDPAMKAELELDGYFLINYELLLARPWLSWFGFQYVVADESYCIANPKARISKLMTRGFRDAKKRFVLSGLPAPEESLNFAQQFLFARGDFMGFKNYWTAREKLFVQAGFDWIPKKGVEPRIREWVNQNAYILTRQKAGVGTKKKYERRFVEQTPEQIALTEKIMNDWESSEQWTKFPVVVNTWLCRVAGGFDPEGRELPNHKFFELTKLVCDELANESVVVFFRFNAELRTARKILREAGESVMQITGKTPVPERARRRRLFMAGKRRVALLQIKCVKWGLNFAKASTIIYYSNSPSLNERKQSEDRIVHLSKSDTLRYIDLVSRGSIDEALVESLRDKNADAKYFMSDVAERWKAQFNARKNLKK